MSNIISKGISRVVILTLAAGLLSASPAMARKKSKKQQKTEQPAPKPAPKPSVDRNGLFHVTKMKTDWFFVIPDSMLGRDMLTTTRFTSTPSGSGKYGGEQLNEQTVYFEMVADSTIAMRARMLVDYADSTDQISRAVTISNENPIISMFKIEKKEGNGYKIKVNGLFNEDNAALGFGQYSKKAFSLTNQTSSYIEDIKSFPTNTEVRIVKTFNSNSTDMAAARSTGKVTIGLNISFILLPEVPMLPRKFDPRVGYFNERYNTFGDDQQRVDRVIYAARWRLEPKPEDVEKMKAGELVEPIKPIVYYIDPATPKQWRKYLIQGVNDWQVAFEKAGFKNAIRAEEWPEDSTMSMEDARYSVIRYLASNIPNAYGPHVSDPRTGEILESHIGWYHNVMSLVHDWYLVQASSIDEAARKMHFDEELMGQLIRFVSSHEVGHTLGLRHNFGSSSTVPVDSLRNKAWVEAHGHTPSIMDYARFNYVAQPEDGISHEGIFPRINDYDKWAIEWGYRPMLGAKDADEDHKMLEPLVKESQKNPRLWWGDGEGYRNDPRRQTEDLGDDAVKASEYGIKNLKRQIVQLPEWTMEEKDIYNENLSTMYGQIRSQFLRYCGHVMNNIGGMLMNFKTNTEAGDVYTPQPKAKQLAALDFIKRNIINEPTWLSNLSYARRISSDPAQLTISVGKNVVTGLVSRVSALNELYDEEAYLNDLTKMIMPNTAKTDRYHEALHQAYVDALINEFKRNNSDTRAAVLSTLKQIKAKTAASTLAHYQNLNDLISRAIVIK